MSDPIHLSTSPPSLGRVAYEAFDRAIVASGSIPWDDLPLADRSAWQVAALAVIEANAPTIATLPPEHAQKLADHLKRLPSTGGVLVLPPEPLPDEL